MGGLQGFDVAVGEVHVGGPFVGCDFEAWRERESISAEWLGDAMT